MIYASSFLPFLVHIPQMFYRRLMLKRFIACGGIALALLACVQQSHVLCGLMGCTNPWQTAAQSLAEADAARDSVTKCGDCCEHESDPRRDAPHQDSDSTIPCGPNCWCCQPPDPRQAPRDTAELTKSRITTLFISAAWPLCIERQSCELDSLAVMATDFSANSSCETCARLCRFLT